MTFNPTLSNHALSLDFFKIRSLNLKIRGNFAEVMENQDYNKLRFEEMDNVSLLMVKEMEVFKTFFQPLKVFEQDPLEEYCLAFTTEKIGNKPLRAYFFNKMLEYLQYDEATNVILKKYPKVLFQVKLPFVFEIVICIQYLHNHILDEKYDSKAAYHEKVCQNLIASNIIREVLFRYLEAEVKPLLKNQKKYEVLLAAIRQLLILVDIGQRMDKSFTNYDHWRDGIPNIEPSSGIFDAAFQKAINPSIAKVKNDIPDKSAFIDAYFHRIYLTNVYLFRCMSEVLMLLSNTKVTQYTKIQQFAIQYGFIIQIINDYSDFAYSPHKQEQKDLETAAKKTTDVFSDLYNFNITLPLIYHLQEDTRRRIRAYLEGGLRRKRLISDFPLQIMQEIVESGSIRKCVTITRNLSKSAMSQLDVTNPTFLYFKDMCAIANYNKFYRILK